LTKPWAIGVSTTPGQTQLARMFLGAVSRAIPQTRAPAGWDEGKLTLRLASSRPLDLP
jgi:hypothetical protein